MSAGAVLRYEGPPSAAAYMLGAVVRGAGPRQLRGLVFPPLRLHWSRFGTGARDRVAIQRVTGLGEDGRMALLAPHFTGFRALMALLTHASLPLPIWRALQVRNRLLLHRYPTGDELELEAGVTGQRVLEKGLEVDVLSVVRERDRPVWESLSTFYYRGQFLEAGQTPATPERPPSIEGGTVASWRVPSGGGWRVARLTGDFNPLHWSARYARRRGFHGAFLHPQLAVGQCLARLPAANPGLPQRLDFWVRGQVYAGVEVHLRAAIEDGSILFTLQSGDEARPALVGRWSPASPGASLGNL